MAELAYELGYVSVPVVHVRRHRLAVRPDDLLEHEQVPRRPREHSGQLVRLHVFRRIDAHARDAKVVETREVRPELLLDVGAAAAEVG